MPVERLPSGSRASRSGRVSVQAGGPPRRTPSSLPEQREAIAQLLATFKIEGHETILSLDGDILEEGERAKEDLEAGGGQLLESTCVICTDSFERGQAS